MPKWHLERFRINNKFNLCLLGSIMRDRKVGLLIGGLLAVISDGETVDLLVKCSELR